MNYSQLYQAIQDYSENTEQTFLLNIPVFVKQTESRIYNSVQLPSLRRNVTGVLTAGNKYVSCPDDWLANYSLAVIDTDGRYNYLLNKDVNYLREAYPNPNSTGLPKYYAVFGPNSTLPKELSLILAPTPNDSYGVELHYFYYPESIVQGVIKTVSITNSGTGYNNGVYKDVYLTGGNGQGAVATIVVQNQSIAGVQIDDGGAFYSAGEVLSANSSDIGGSGVNLAITILTVGNAQGTSWVGDNYDPVLFYGAMREAVLFMKGEQDMVAYYEKMFQEALAQLKRLGDGLERGDAYRDGQTKLKVNT